MELSNNINFDDKDRKINYVSDKKILDILNNINKYSLFKKYELTLNKFPKQSEKYKVGILQILLNILLAKQGKSSKLLLINGIVDDKFLQSMKIAYPKFTTITDYSIDKIMEELKSYSMVKEESLYKPSKKPINEQQNKNKNDVEVVLGNEAKNIQNSVEEENGLENLTDDTMKIFLNKIMTNKGANSILNTYLKAKKKTISEIRNSLTLSEKIAILQIYIIELDKIKRQEESDQGKYVYTQYYEQHKITKVNGVFDSNTIYILNYLLPNFDNTIAQNDLKNLLMLKLSEDNPKIAKNNIKKEKPKIISKNPSRQEREKVLSVNRKSFVDKKMANRILDYMDEPSFLRCYNYLNKNLGFDEITTAAICGNIFIESGFNTMLKGDHGSAHGLCQRRLDRRQALQNFAKGKGSVNKRSIQLEFIKHELNGDYSDVLRKMNSAKTVFEKTKIFMNGYERPKNIAKINKIAIRKSFGGAILAEL